MARSMNAFLVGLCGISFITASFAYQPYTTTSNTDPYLMIADNNSTSQPSKNHKKSSTKKHKGTTNVFPAIQAATGTEVFIFDPRVRKWAAYDADGNLIKTGRASGGKNYCPDIRKRCRTPVGEFSVYAKKGAGCKSKKFPVGRGGAPMPYCTFFHGGFAIHGSHDVRSYNASHGCIRVTPTDAHWLQNFLGYGATVIVRPY